MPGPPLIGLPGRRKKGSQIVDFPDVLGDLDLDLYFADYGRAIIEAGGLPVNLPIDVDVEAVARRLDGVLLTGGTDIDPARYGAEPDPELLDIETERDELELRLLGCALDRGLPVLGICRGIQLINVHLGGTLNQHVPEHARFDVPTETPVHQVSLAAGSVLRDLYGDRREVNSLHHQTVAEVGDGLRVTATADDGTVEGLEFADTVVAVQWHPEMMASRPTDPIFGWLVERALS